MKKVYFSLLFLSLTLGVKAQTLNTSGDWNVTSNWSTGVVPNNISSNVDFKQTKSATIKNGYNYSVGSVDLTNQNTLTIESGSRLNVGTVSQNRNFTTNNDAFLYVHGELYIYGDLEVNNNLTLIVTGTMYVSGSVVLKNNGSLTVSGDLAIDGSFTGDKNTSLHVDGAVSIGGDITVGNNSSLTGTGNINLEGSCTDDGSGSFCGFGPLPVTLLYFKASAQNNAVQINWASAKAWDFSHYELERSENGKEFYRIGAIDAEELSNETVEYAFTDYQPVSGTSYYRLKAVDIDGKFEYKGIELVKFGAETFKVYPNPSATGFVTVDWSHSGSNAIASLKDNSGRTIRQTSIGGQNNKLDTSGLPAGLYLLIIQSDAGKQQTQLLIQ